MSVPEDQESSQTGAPSAGAHQAVILVVDDEVVIRDLMTIILQGQGWAVLSASDGREALELSRTYRGTIDLVISDLDMPRINGTDLCARLLAERPKIRAIVMSGTEMGRNAIRNTSLPFLRKPFLGDSLIDKVRETLGPSPAPGSKQDRDFGAPSS
jgi:DNA-binding NtrC family response regulator